MPCLYIVLRFLAQIQDRLFRGPNQLEVVVVNEASHTDFNPIRAVRRCVKGSVTLFVIQIEVSIHIVTPDAWGSCAALASAKDRKFNAVRVGFGGDSQFGFDSIHCMLKHITVDLCNIPMQAKRSSKDV